MFVSKVCRILKMLLVLPQLTIRSGDPAKFLFGQNPNGNLITSNDLILKLPFGDGNDNKENRHHRNQRHRNLAAAIRLDVDAPDEQVVRVEAREIRQGLIAVRSVRKRRWIAPMARVRTNV